MIPAGITGIVIITWPLDFSDISSFRAFFVPGFPMSVFGIPVSDFKTRRCNWWHFEKEQGSRHFLAREYN